MVYCDESEYRVWVILKRAVASIDFVLLKLFIKLFNKQKLEW